MKIRSVVVFWAPERLKILANVLALGNITVKLHKQRTNTNTDDTDLTDAHGYSVIRVNQCYQRNPCSKLIYSINR